MRFSPGGCNCWNISVLVVIDTSGSMAPGGCDGLAKTKNIVDDLPALCGRIARWAVVDYKDQGDSGYADGFEVHQAFTENFSTFETALDALTATGGGDVPEQGFQALKKAAEEWETTLGGPSDDIRVIIWAGDAPCKNDLSGAYPTRTQTITALTNAGITVMVFNFAGVSLSHLNTATPTDNAIGAGSKVAADTGGTIYTDPTTANSSAIASAICAL